MNDMQAIAHAAQDENGNWLAPHGLEEHLRAVAILAAQFAFTFNSSDWAHLAGMWHDLGKYLLRFQRYIRKVSGYYEADAHIYLIEGDHAGFSHQKLITK